MVRTRDRNCKIERFGRIGVLAGGPSSEREISIKSGKAVYNALRREGFDVVFVDIQNDIKNEIKRANIDVAFIALHGGFGEDGTIQHILENMGIPYTGSGPVASRLALDKLASRKIFQHLGLDVPKYEIFERGKRINLNGLNIPFVVKPQKEGSSIGLSVVFRLGEFKKAVEKAFSYGHKIIIEEFINGRELTVGNLSNEPLPVVEIIPENGIYDYRAKYSSSKTRYLIPAPLKKEIFLKAQEMALTAHRGLGCRFFSRVDMILDDVQNKIYILEVNTIPGLTSRSLLPKAALAAGISFDSLCISILKGAIEDESYKRKKDAQKSLKRQIASNL